MKRKPAKPMNSPENEHNGDSSEQLGLERLVFFSDAVFAIAITLLALEIRLPALEEPLTNEQLWQSLLAIWPSYLGFTVSFLVVGGFWISHHRKFRFIKRFDRNFMLLNLLLLMLIAFIPFPTSVLIEYGNRTATIFYAVVVTLAGLLLLASWAYASSHNRLLAPHVDAQQKRSETLRTLVAPAIFALSIGLAFINDDLAKFSWLLIVPTLRLSQ